MKRTIAEREDNNINTNANLQKRLYSHHTRDNNNNNSSEMSGMYIYSESTATSPQNSVILITEVINIVILFVLSVSPVPDTSSLLIDAHPFK